MVSSEAFGLACSPSLGEMTGGLLFSLHGYQLVITGSGACIQAVFMCSVVVFLGHASAP